MSISVSYPDAKSAEFTISVDVAQDVIDLNKVVENGGATKDQAIKSIDAVACERAIKEIKDYMNGISKVDVEIDSKITDLEAQISDLNDLKSSTVTPAGGAVITAILKP